MLSGVREDLFSLQTKLTVGDVSLSLKWYVEELQQKYESKVEQGCGCDLKVKYNERRQHWLCLIPKEELGEEIKALKATC